MTEPRPDFGTEFCHDVVLYSRMARSLYLHKRLSGNRSYERKGEDIIGEQHVRRLMQKRGAGVARPCGAHDPTPGCKYCVPTAGLLQEQAVRARWFGDTACRSERSSQVDLQGPSAVETWASHPILMMWLYDLIATKIATHILQSSTLVTTPQVPVLHKLNHLISASGTIPVGALYLLVRWQWNRVRCLEQTGFETFSGESWTWLVTVLNGVSVAD